jgi:hypothetical protein
MSLRDAGLNLVDIVVTTRPWWGGKRSDTHLAMSHEYIFFFTKSNRWFLDRTPIYPLLEGAKYEGATCPGNAWVIKESWPLASYNPAEVYPTELAAAIMKMICLLPGSVVFDPIMGGPNGLISAVSCGHSFIGFESDPRQYEKYGKVIKKIQRVIKDRDNEHKE